MGIGIYLLEIIIVGILSFKISQLIYHLFASHIKSVKVFKVSLTVLLVLIIMSLLIMIQFNVPKLCYSPPINKYQSDEYNTKSGNYNQQWDELVQGKIAYNIPDTMEIEENYKAIVSITKAMNDSILFQYIDNSDFKIAKIKISSRVKVILMDPAEKQNFRITSLNTEEQIVDDSTNTVWKWNIIPLKGGDHELVLRTTVKVLDHLGENYKDKIVFEKNIKVNAPVLVTMKQFIGDYWQWLTSVCFIPLIIWGYDRLSKRGKAKAKNKPILGFKIEDKNKKKTKSFDNEKSTNA